MTTCHMSVIHLSHASAPPHRTTQRSGCASSSPAPRPPPQTTHLELAPTSAAPVRWPRPLASSSAAPVRRPPASGAVFRCRPNSSLVVRRRPDSSLVCSRYPVRQLELHESPRAPTPRIGLAATGTRGKSTLDHQVKRAAVPLLSRGRMLGHGGRPASIRQVPGHD